MSEFNQGRGIAHICLEVEEVNAIGDATAARGKDALEAKEAPDALDPCAELSASPTMLKIFCWHSCKVIKKAGGKKLAL